MQKSSCCIRFVRFRKSSLSQCERATPKAEFSWSTVPYASTRSEDFDTRIPPARPVCPPSLRLVAMLME
jgi:hypothetical protein